MIAAFERSYYEENVAELNLNFVLNSQAGLQNFLNKIRAPEIQRLRFLIYSKFIMNYLNKWKFTVFLFE